MYYDRKVLFKKSLKSALKLRKKFGLLMTSPVSIFDFVESQGIEVRFEPLSSLDGMYSPDHGPVIILGAERPYGRMRYNCAHEFGHHVYGHGIIIDQYMDHHSRTYYDKKEFIADSFAANLLMPPMAIEYAFKSRHWNMKHPTSLQIFTVASQFGVGYSTLVTHLNKSLNLIDNSEYEQLLKIHPKKLKKELLGFETEKNVAMVDSHWVGRPIDLEIGDFIHVPRQFPLEFDDSVTELISSMTDKMIYKINKIGISKIFNSSKNWSVFLRVSRKNYTGMNKYRYLG